MVVRKIGFTGTRSGMSEKQKEKVRTLLKDFKPTIAFHGMCIGADEDFHNICREFPNIFIIGLPGVSAQGTNTKYRSKVKVDLELPEDTHFSRNRKIVDCSDILIGCPYNDNQESGGTWYTIKYAKKIKRGVFVINRE